MLIDPMNEHDVQIVGIGKKITPETFSQVPKTPYNAFDAPIAIFDGVPTICGGHKTDMCFEYIRL